MGIGATVNSYYAGQSRRIQVLEGLRSNDWIEEMRSVKVLNFDMETETIFTLASILGMKAANTLVVHGNRITNLWLSQYRKVQLENIRVALGANLDGKPL